MASIDTHIKDFLDFLVVEKNLAPSTLKEYGYDLNGFARFLQIHLGRVPMAAEIDHHLLRAYLVYRMDKGNNSRTRARKVSALRSFFTFLVREGVISTNPAANLVTPKPERNLPKFLTLAECEQLLATISARSTNPERDAAIVKFFIYTGLRLSELVRLKLSQVDLENRELRVSGKGNKDRVLPLTEGAVEVLQSYLAVRPSSDSDILFLGSHQNHHQPLTTRAVQLMVENYTHMAGLGSKKLSPHALRHTFATLLYGANVGLLELQRLLGHDSLASTQIYTHTDPERLRAAVERHPVKE